MNIRLVSVSAGVLLAASAFGGETAPFASIQAAVAAASDGATIKVRPGIYDNGGANDPDGRLNRVYVTGKKLKIVATGRKEETHIVGRHATTTAEGFGPDAVRCVCIRGTDAIGTEIIGFTIRDGASNNYRPTSDVVQDSGGGVLALDGDKKYFDTNAYVVDCVISNCVGIRAGATRGVTAVRCLITRNDASNSGSAGRNSSFVNCLITRNTGSSFLYEGTPKVYNCTLVNNDSRLYGADVRNSVVMNNTYQNNKGVDTIQFMSGPGFTHSVTRLEGYDPKFDETVGDSSTSVTEADNYQFLAPLYDDFRVLEGSETETAGDAEELARLSLPDDIDPYVDFFGNAIPKSGAIAAGCIQTVVGRPQGGAFQFDDFRKIRTNGGIVYGKGLYAFAEAYPTQFLVQAAAQGATPIHSFVMGGSIVFPMMDDSLWVTPPPGPDNVLTGTVYAASSLLFVDPSDPSATDEREGIETGVPYRTIQKAIADSPTYRSVVKVAAGEYMEEPYAYSAALTRVYIDRQVRLLGAGADCTTIRGLAASGTNGQGSDGVRCVLAGCANCAIQGFTLADGYADSVDTGENYRTSGGGVNAYQVASGARTLVRVLDCVITNCWAARGGGVYGTTCERTKIVNCFGSKSAQRNAKFVSCVFENTYEPNIDGQYGNGSYNGIHINCTVVGRKDNSTYMLNKAGGNPLTNTIVQTTREFKYTADCAGSIVWDVMTFDSTVVEKIDPQLAHVSKGNYRLTGTSPAIGYGVAIYDPLICWADFEGRPMNFTDGKPAAGAFQYPVRRVTVETANGVVSDPSGACGPETDGTLEIAFGDVEGRHVSGVIVDGEKTVFAPGQTSVTLTIPEGDLAAAVSVQPFVDWYVNPNTDAAGGRIVGDDANDGAHPTTPKRTLQGVFGTGYVLAGDTVHAAEGVYDDGEDTVKKARVRVTSGTTLVADAGPEKTFIVGHFAGTGSDEAHLGNSALRVAYVESNAKLSGFTLTGGATDVYSGSSTKGNGAYGGGAVICGNSASVVSDCIISNNYSGIAACLDGTYVRCRIVENCATKRASAAQSAALHQCFIDRNRSANGALDVLTGMWNCTMGAKNTKLDGSHFVGVNNGGQMMNCVFLGWVYSTSVATNCFLVKGETPSDMSLLGNCTIFDSADEIGLDDEGRPLARLSAVVDAGSNALMRTEHAMSDLAGIQRVYNTRVDVGCYEYDWRPDYSAAIGVTVAEASPGVTASDGAVVIPADGKVTVDWPNSFGKPKKSTFRVAVAEGSELTVTSNGEPLAAFGPGEETFKYRCPAEGDVLEFACTGLGSAAIADFVRGSGMLLLVR